MKEYLFLKEERPSSDELNSYEKPFVVYVNNNTKEVIYSGNISLTCNVKFVLNGHGDYIQDVKINKGDKLNEDDYILTSDGLEFLGWYTDEDLNIKFNFNDSITTDLTLYAKWQRVYKRFIISIYNINNELVFEQEVEQGETLNDYIYTPSVISGMECIGLVRNGDNTLFDFDTPIVESLTQNGIVRLDEVYVNEETILFNFAQNINNYDDYGSGITMTNSSSYYEPNAKTCEINKPYIMSSYSNVFDNAVFDDEANAQVTFDGKYRWWWTNSKGELRLYKTGQESTDGIYSLFTINTDDYSYIKKLTIATTNGASLLLDENYSNKSLTYRYFNTSISAPKITSIEVLVGTIKSLNHIALYPTITPWNLDDEHNEDNKHLPEIEIIELPDYDDGN